MNHAHESSEDPKKEIVSTIAELSALLGMIPSDGTIDMQVPVMDKKMALSDWLSATRHSFFNLSLLVSKELDIQLQ